MSATKRRGRQPNSAAGGTNKTFSKSTSATSLENTHGEGALNSAANSVSLGSNSGSVSGQKTGTEMLVSSHKSRSNSNKRSTIETVSNDNSAAKKSENLDQQPFVSGNSLVVKYRDGSDRLAKIICFTERTDSNTGVVSYSYYIHYNDFNRRMDEWIATDRIVLTPSKANIQQLQLNNTVANDNNENSNKPTTVADMDHDEHEGLDEQSLIEHEELTKVKNIRYVQLGKYIMECWYFSPFPKEFYPNGYIDCLYFCEFSLRFFKSKEELLRYQKKYDVPRHPPGTEIYRDDNVSMFELDGAVEKIYCQNLCYFAKLFLDHKTLYWDVDPFLFYVLCTRDSRGFHPVGYFSKEK